jgi:antibiotic biosynthesis monooxygenase (ABM) superfamily enzyme
MIKYKFDRVIEIIVFFLFLINTILGTLFLVLNYFKICVFSDTIYIILFTYFILTIFALGEILIKRWHYEDKNKKP